MLIGLSGFKQSGKDTVANYLVEKYRFGKHGFADKLRELALEVNPLIESDYEEVMSVGSSVGLWTVRRAEKSERTIGYIKLKDLVDDVGYEKAKEFKAVRKFYQDEGVAHRVVFGEDFWVDQLYKQLEATYGTYTKDLGVETFQGNVVISDCRFPNEAEFIRRMGGLVIAVDRGLESTDTHVSEIPLPLNLTDGTLQNLGSVEVLHQGIEDMLDFIGFKK